VGDVRKAVTIDDVRRVASSLPRSEEHFIQGRVKFRVGRIVYLAFSRDGKTMGFAFPKEWRTGLVEAEPEKFCMPSAADLRYNWVCVRLEAIHEAEMRTLVTDAWRIVVPKRVAAARLDGGKPPRATPTPRTDPSRSGPRRRSQRAPG
jgi:hypothetical protein